MVSVWGQLRTSLCLASYILLHWLQNVLLPGYVAYSLDLVKLGPKLTAANSIAWVLSQGPGQKRLHALTNGWTLRQSVPRIRMLEDHVRVEWRSEE